MDKDIYLNHTALSSCCGVPMFDDIDVCPECKEHCTIAEICEQCEGTGEINKEECKECNGWGYTE